MVKTYVPDKLFWCLMLLWLSAVAMHALLYVKQGMWTHLCMLCREMCGNANNPRDNVAVQQLTCQELT